MFVLKKSYTYFWPVNVEIPKDGGKFEKFSFEAQFKQLPQSRIKEVFGDSSEVKDVDFCKESMVGWKGVKDENGEDVPFSISSLEEMLEMPSVAKNIVSAFVESIAGSKIKN